MARRIAINFKEVKPIIVGPAGKFQATRIQRFEIPVNFPTTDVDELGNRLHVGQVTDLPEITVTFQALDVSAKLFAALAGRVWANWPTGTYVDASALGYVDVIGEIKEALSEDIAKSVHVRKGKITGFTYSYTVDGDATEEYTIQSTDKRWLKYDVIVDEFAGAAATYTLTQTPLLLKNGDKLLTVLASGVYFDEVAATPAAGEYSVSATTMTLGEAVTAANKVVAVYHANKAGANWTDTSDAAIPVAIRGKNIPVKLLANNIDRVQSITFRGTFPTTTVREMGRQEVVGYVTAPTMVEGDISVLDTDTQLVALFATGAIDPVDIELRACEFTAAGISLEVILYDPALECNLPVASGTVMKTLYVPAITITSEGHATSVGGNATQTFGFKSTAGDLRVYRGAKV